ncbi:MAG: HNH endonuclease [Polyangiaceae bacterium]
MTDKAWFDFLASHAHRGVVDEVNFWSPSSTEALKEMSPGEPIFFRLKKPWHAVAGYGFFAHFSVLDLDVAWDCFAWKNGDPDKIRFLGRIGAYRGLDLLDPGARRERLGCTILRSAHFWPEERWLPWGEAEGWHANIVRGRTERNPARAARLLAEMDADQQIIPDDLTAQPFELVAGDERTVAVAARTEREGQGAFRTRVLDAYGRRCAITGEHTEPVLDAAHIQPYLGTRSNHVQNGLLLTKEFHTLFDLGYVAVTPAHEVLVSPALQRDWHNGKRYYPFDHRKLVAMPERKELQPSAKALEWHLANVFRRAS